jgi:hypothetical protein
MGITIGDDKLFTLHFADDQVILAADERDVYHTLRKLKEYNSFGLTIKMSKTKYVCCERLWWKSAIRSRQCEKSNFYKYLRSDDNRKWGNTDEIKIESR